MGDRRGLVRAPARAETVFRSGIRHPDLWLWDAWTFENRGVLHLFTLALARRTVAGAPITPGERNDFPFHVRRFVSGDDGRSWRDCGPYLEPCDAAGGALAHNVWSGSATPWGDDLLFAFTGVRRPAPGRSFVQSICLLRASLDGEPPDPARAIVISDPNTDYDAIRAAGYYLGAREALGADAGEDGGPILAWRDPFLLPRGDGSLDAFWAAKTAPGTPAVAHARLTPAGDGFKSELRAPILLPDGDEFTQAEVPKIYPAPMAGGWLMLLSTCNRRSETQPDAEVSKELRLYTAESPGGPWRPYARDRSVIPDARHLFGGSLIGVDGEAGVATLIAPFTEMAAPELQLTFAPPKPVAFGGGKTHVQRAAGGG